jgi:hypothetical protein
MTQWGNGQMNWTELFKGISPNGQKTLEEVLNIHGHKENASKNHVKIPTHSC